MGPLPRALAERSAELRQSLGDVDPERFGAALDRAISARGRSLVEAIERYRRHPYRRRLTDPPTLWADGPARLLDYGAAGGSADRRDGPPLLVVPSLINRAYVLDLSERRSLLRWLAGAGFRPLLLDWGAPDAERRQFTLTDYVAGTLDGALDAVLEVSGRAPLLLGYCMGGLLALALAQRRQRDLAGLALLATPWDFHAGSTLHGPLGRAAVLGCAPALDLFGELPVDAIQALFASLDPELGVRKFLAFARLDPDGRRAEDFVALEDWLNDGVPLAAPVARECLGGWYGENTPARGLWRIAGRPVEPAAVELPSLVLVPAQDRIVPPASALALGEAIPGAEIRRPATGHIGMVVSGGAPEAVWRPLADWLSAQA
ncbi:alpha/beta fold hydrolase [Tistlia consotensis]|uniref:alpha/beta fold hydrolase n=1 Tax=Tistlia consotensis TaxID=1321365 RepID=UPI001C52973C|nr:alpha/beta fold hydrolase [Tistlia consotensis]